METERQAYRLQVEKARLRLAIKLSAEGLSIRRALKKVQRMTDTEVLNTIDEWEKER